MTKIFDIKEICFVILGGFLFSLPCFLEMFVKSKKKCNKNNSSKVHLLALFSEIITVFLKNILLSGVFISLIFLLEDLNSPELDITKENYINQVIKKILLSFRPLTYSFLVYIIFSKIFFVFVKEKENSKQFQDVKMENTSLLSKRENEVAKLATQGMTNLQIAEELYISPETVKRHLATIYSKTGINSRKELNLTFQKNSPEE